MWSIYLVEYYSTVFKISFIMKFKDKWMELEKVLINEVTWMQNNRYGMYSLISRY